MIQVSLQPEYIFSWAGFSLSNTLFTSCLVSLLLVVLSLYFYFFKKQIHKNFLINGLKIIIFELLKLTDSVTKNRQLSKKILPLISTLFLFIVSANLLALVPGFLGSFYIKTDAGQVPLLRSPNSDLNTTLALAIVSVLCVQIFALRYLGIKVYLKKFFNLSSPIKFVLGMFEMISEGVRVLSLSFRLFGNIFGGEVLLLVIAFLAPYFIPLPFMILEVFVGFIQAFIFSMIVLTFFRTSLIKHL